MVSRNYEAGKGLLFVQLELTSKPTAPLPCENRIGSLALLLIISLFISGLKTCPNHQCEEAKDIIFNVHSLSDIIYLTQCPHNHLPSDERIHTCHLTHNRFSVYIGIYNGTHYLSECIKNMLTSHNDDDTNNLTRTFECHHPNGDPYTLAIDHKWVLVRTFPSPVRICYDRTNWTSYYQNQIRVIVGD